jgi:hypothetical protein
MIIPNNVLFDDVVSMLSKGHTVTLRAKGNSMFPFIIGGRDAEGRMHTGGGYRAGTFGRETLCAAPHLLHE